MEKSKLISEIKSRKLPFKEAIKISFKNVKIRISRSLITTMGIFLGIAFLVSVFSSSLIVNAYEEQLSMSLQARQYWLVVMSLLVCSVGITNSMLMSIFERYKEIGTMKCLGALDKFIIELFLLESGLMGLVGSVSGSLLGLASTVLIYSYRFKENVLLNVSGVQLLGYIFLAIVIGTLLSVLAAIYPAYRAAKLPPASALRSEI